MIKVLECGSVVDGCSQSFRGLDEGGILERAGEHAEADHGMSASDYASAALPKIKPV